jgi:hypothetical protein
MVGIYMVAMKVKHAPELLQMLLAALVTTKFQAVEVEKRCQTQAHAGHKSVGLASGYPIQFFGCRDKRLSSGE